MERVSFHLELEDKEWLTQKAKGEARSVSAQVSWIIRKEKEKDAKK